ncbi:MULTISPECIES: hypothetical protein [Pseudomonas]|uniref:Major facilitator superfamily (MFS) profile domain-containing protein n=1 Tax=Pseudomonas luteola TaxID=47886 RepID=A0ABS0MZQ3_PSELU|nr:MULTISPECIES: hypothetical protein [Pseudomonas]MBA1250382.1 hypothetical protein [Pseudomonas zeshuii]MBH3441454.1 hypothetical protein [Pseudomonas luteola]MBW5415287.1 hypothetical protein [Pseudomonas sp. MAG002Y]QEU26602.1 hypothetical protein FOB45_01950 [Pseudomonas luteola]
MGLSSNKRIVLSQDLRKVGVAGISIGIISPLFASQLAEVGLGSYWLSGLALTIGLVAWIAGLVLTPSVKEA